MRYKSKKGEIHDYLTWRTIAYQFYIECSSEVPADWWVRWSKVLGLVPVFGEVAV